MHRGWRLVDAAFQKQVARAQQAGQVDPNLEPEAVSQALLMSLLGLLTLVRADIPNLRRGIDVTFALLGMLSARHDGP